MLSTVDSGEQLGGEGGGVARVSVCVLSLTAGASQLAAVRRVANSLLEIVVWCCCTDKLGGTLNIPLRSFLLSTPLRQRPPASPKANGSQHIGNTVLPFILLVVPFVLLHFV